MRGYSFRRSLILLVDESEIAMLARANARRRHGTCDGVAQLALLPKKEGTTYGTRYDLQ